MLCACSSAAADTEETMSTMRFAQVEQMLAATTHTHNHHHHHHHHHITTTTNTTLILPSLLQRCKRVSNEVIVNTKVTRQQLEKMVRR